MDISIIKTIDNKIVTDIYYKTTNNFAYLPLTSNHPRHIKRNIPYCLMNLINRIVSEPTLKLLRMNEIKVQLLKLYYPNNLIDDSIIKALATTQTVVNPLSSNKFNISFINFNNHLTNSIYNKFNTSTKQILLTNTTFKTFENINYRKTTIQQPNILNYLQIPTNYSINKCNKPRCKCCKILIPYRKLIIIKDMKFYINYNGNCQTKNVIYILFCCCNKSYIGQTITQFNLRINLHRDHSNNIDRTILNSNKHIHKCGGNFKTTILFIATNNDTMYLNQMEEYFIKIIKPELNTRLA